MFPDPEDSWVLTGSALQLGEWFMKYRDQGGTHRKEKESIRKTEGIGVYGLCYLGKEAGMVDPEQGQDSVFLGSMLVMCKGPLLPTPPHSINTNTLCARAHAHSPVETTRWRVGAVFPHLASSVPTPRPTSSIPGRNSHLIMKSVMQILRLGRPQAAEVVRLLDC